jgi:hypothetical protein
MATSTIPFSTLTFGMLADLLDEQAVRDVLMSMCSVSDSRRDACVAVSQHCFVYSEVIHPSFAIRPISSVC